MATEVRMSPSFPRFTSVRIDRFAGIGANERTAPDASSNTPTVISICSTFLVVLTALGGCTNLRYGQIDCAVLEGEAARMCQEYRQRKADADIRIAAEELVQGYSKCVTANKSNPDAVKKNCSKKPSG